MLGWQEVCVQVGRFCRTPMGMEAAHGPHGLALGSSREVSERLLRETEQALHLTTPLSGVSDYLDAVEGAGAGLVLSVDALGALLQTLQLAEAARDGLTAQKDARPDLAAYGPALRLTELLHPLTLAVRPGVPDLLDSASAELGAVREAARRAAAELDHAATAWARRLHASGVAERPLVVQRRDRACCPVRRARKGDLPRGSLTLALSASGATAYMEPAELVPLNNAIAALAGREEEEVAAVLASLSRQVARHAGALLAARDALCALDLASARAAHARWLGAQRPTFGAGVELEGMRHPALLGVSLGHASGGEEAGAEGARASPTPSLPPPPVPIGLHIPPASRVAAITGPNTGGKTAALKTLGLACLMARAGLFLPAGPGPRLPFFEAVLADLGSGTEPSEGAAIATATLTWLAGRAGLTLVTTHHTAVRALATSRDDFCCAAVGFDGSTLHPTYSLTWGSLRGLAEEVGGLREERAAAERALEAALRERATAEAELLACEREAANVEERMAQEAAADEAELKARIRTMLHEARTGFLDGKAARRELTQMRGRLQPAREKQPPGAPNPRAAPVVRVGDIVAVAQLKGATGMVVKVAGDVLTVRAGALRVQVRAADVWQAGQAAAKKR
ncbi:Endonuclease MutS2 [Auxenochlorella protothecoides]|uniref:Endonuclease MutS2 n=1 Tax=Auxenochlorella protothecoides TaxID=3075 RepID=A0A087SFH8_AUXPR|nr:Endonuclease MutS2 [Auxenochlorella protothecoides]KFM24482.1 Endonuclease MutS2 [Auxenochlorella protothecoides]